VLVPENQAGFGKAGGPVGSVMAYAGALDTPERETRLAAQGWLPCDGRTLEITTYPQLFAVLGYLYGGQGGQFRLPDYRGYFLRGIDGGSGVDPDAWIRVAAEGGQPNGIGSTQRSALQDHAHRYARPREQLVPWGGHDPMPGSAGAADAVTNEPVGIGGAPFQVSEGETRPVNIYVHYIIRFSHPIG